MHTYARNCIGVAGILVQHACSNTRTYTHIYFLYVNTNKDTHADAGGDTSECTDCLISTRASVDMYVHVRATHTSAAESFASYKWPHHGYCLAFALCQL